ncbi:replication initiation protein [Helicobacter cynogastricus]|uniref:replication initiation protein n=1 Tax=Helicobacter cynogastricus TaxID=329937 RepID=UPI000CF04D11|nr:replication initiation protein [Helicobacter cynogastricus]
MRTDYDATDQLEQQIRGMNKILEDPTIRFGIKELIKKEKEKALKELLLLYDSQTTKQLTESLSPLDSQQENSQQFPKRILQESSVQKQVQETLVSNTQGFLQEQQATEKKEVLAVHKLPSTLAKDLTISNPGQVVLHNDIYKVNLGKLGAWESNLLFSIFNKLKDHGDTLVLFNPQEIKKLIGNLDIGNRDLVRITKMLWNKIKAANFWVLLPRRDENHMLFRTFAINYHDDQKTHIKDIEVRVNHPYFTYLLNGLQANFTAFQLQTFISLRSKYAKTLYRLLVRFEDIKNKVGMCEVHTYTHDFEGFKEFMGIPENMRIDMVEERVLKPACKELAPEEYNHENPDRTLPYESIRYEKQKKGRGGKIVGITFYFVPHPHLSMQKTIFKRQTQNRIQDTLNQQQKEEAQQVREQREAQLGFYNKAERIALNSFCGLSGSLYIKNPEHIFQNVKLIKILTRQGNNPSIVCLFQLTPTHPNDRIYASYCTEHLERFKAKGSDYFTHIFKDHEDLIANFVKNAH